MRTREDGWVYPGCPHAGPSLKVDARGVVHVAWWTGKEGEAGVYYARSEDGGRPSPRSRSRPARRARPAHVQLALAGDGGVFVAWDDGLSEMPRVLVRRSADGGRSFGAASSAQRSREPRPSFPVLAVYGDSVAVAWSQTTAAEHRAKLAARST